MNKPEFVQLDNLIHAFLEGRLSEADQENLNNLLRKDTQAQDRYLELVDLHSCLAVEEKLWVDRSIPDPGKLQSDLLPWWSPGRVWFWAALAAMFLVSLGLVWLPGRLPSTWNGNVRPPVATFGDLRDPQWVSHSDRIVSGDSIVTGQRVELSSGSASLRFGSGAVVKLIGPAILEALTENSAFLLLGQARVVAEEPRAKGFTLQTRTARLIDIGTQFVASAAPDGQSRVDVAVGSVDVRLKDIDTVQHLRAGDALCVEAGERRVMTRIESGDGSSAFRFPTIEPPSNQDYADRSRRHARIEVLRGALQKGEKGASGPVSVLIDGKGQSHEDSPNESAFFANGEQGAFLLDLGKTVNITKINTYSWHQNTTFLPQRHRAVQKYTLYGHSGDHLPGTAGSLIEQGWVRVTRVNSDDFFQVADPLDRPAQQACSITAARGTIGKFRYLLWEVESTLGWHTRETNNTFYGEFDVYAEETP